MAKNLDVGIEIKLDDNGSIKKVTTLTGKMKGLAPAADQASGGLSKMGKVIGGLGLAYAAKQALDFGVAMSKMAINAGISALKTADSFEGMKLQLTALRGSSVRAEQDFKWIQNFAKTTPLQLDQVTGSFNKLVAYGLEPTTGSMKSLVDMSFKYGNGAETLDSAILALGKAWGKGKIEAEEWNMMAERGIPIGRMMSDMLGVTEAQLFDMRKEGKFTREVIGDLLDYMGGDAAGAAGIHMERLSGIISNLKDTITQALGEIGSGEAMKNAKKALKDISATLTDLENAGTIQDLADAFAAFTESVAAFARVIRTNSGGIAKFFKLLSLASIAISQTNTKAFDGFTKLMISLGLATEIVTDDTQEMIEVMKEMGYTQEQITDIINGQIVAMEDVALVTKGAGDELVNLGDTGEDVFKRLADTVLLTVGPRGKFYTAFAGMESIVEETMEPIPGIMKKVGEDGSDAILSSFSDMLGKGFMGEWETFSDLWDALWTDAAKSMAGIIGNAFEDAMKDGGTLGGIGARFWDNMKTSIEKNPLGAGVAGAGMIMQGREQGGAGGVMQGLMGGMSMGGAIGSLFPGAGTAIGMGIGAVVGAAVAFFGGGDDPRTGYTYGSGGFNVTSSDGQDLGPGAWVQWEKNMNALVRESKLAYRGLLKMFGDPDLFNLVGALGEFSVGRAGTLEDVAAYIADEWLPSQMDTVFGQAMRKGFGDLGLGEGEIDNLFAELGQLGGEDRVNALQDIVAALVMFNEALTDFGSGSALLDILDQNPMEAFADSMAEVRDNIDLVTVGWENMSLQDRAREAQEIGVLFQGALQTTLQLLQQIDQVRGSINQSFESMIEGFALGGMTDAQKQQYYQDQIGSLTGQLGSATDAAEIAQITADIQRYIQSLGGMFDGEDLMGAGFGGTTWNEYLSGLATAAQEAANARLDMIEQEVLSEYDALVARMREAEEALTGFTDAVNNAGGGTGVGGGGGGNEQGQVAPKSTTVNVTVGGEMAPLINLIYSIVDDRVGGDPNSIQ